MHRLGLDIDVGHAVGAAGVTRGTQHAFGTRRLIPARIGNDSGTHGQQVPVLVGPDGEEVGRGLVGYGSNELSLIAGSSSADAAKILNVTVGSPVIHRNDLLITDPSE